MNIPDKSRPPIPEQTKPAIRKRPANCIFSIRSLQLIFAE